MVLVLSTIGLLVLLFLIMFALARSFEGHSVADIIDWKPTRSPEVEAQNEVDDVAQMLEAANAARRRRGLAERTEDDVAGALDADRRELDRRAREYRPDPPEPPAEA